MQSLLSFVLDGKIVTLDFQDSSIKPTTTLLNYLRSLSSHKGVKEGCAEGDCGACTVVIGERGQSGKISYQSVDSCLIFLPMLHGKQVITVENLEDTAENLHPVQQAMVDQDASQCGFCTPGIVMSLFGLYKNHVHPSRIAIEDALTGNLCRCTGYKPIMAAAAQACVSEGIDHFTQEEPQIQALLGSIPEQSLTIKTLTQHYFRPKTLQEALMFKAHNPKAIVICGASDIALRVTKKHELLDMILDISVIEALKSSEWEGFFLVLGAGLPLSRVALQVKDDFPALFEMLSVFGSLQIRNVATLGGNLGTASPIGDTLPVLMAYQARIVLQDANGQRDVPINDFITGYRSTLKKPEELITRVILPKLPEDTIVKSYKVSKRKDLDISTVSAGFRLQLDEAKRVKSIVLAYGGMAERIKRAYQTEQFLLNKTWQRQTIEAAMPLIDREFTPISDARASAQMRSVAAKNLLLKFWLETLI